MAPPRKKLVDALAIAFGISSWIEISGLGVEMPLMVDVLPEGWYLGSYIVVITQIANIGPLLYGIARKYKSHKVLEIPTIHITLCIAVTSCLLLAAFWDQTSIISGENHSTALLTLAFTLALVDCTSSVLYLPFMATFRDIYVISCMIGEGACGFFPSILGFVQGVGGDPNCQNKTIISNTEYGNETTYELVPIVPQPLFSVRIYFIFLSIMVVISWIAFVLLLKLPRIQGEKIIMDDQKALNPSAVEHESIIAKDVSELNSNKNRKQFFILLAFQTFICFFQNGVVSSIQPFSCKPYGNIIYHLSVNLSLISNPIGCFIALLYPKLKMKSVIYATLFSSIWGFYILIIATFSPIPPMRDNMLGGFLMVCSWTIYVGTVSYIKAIIAAILRRDGGNKALFWGGAVSQIGSATGGVVMFIVLKYTEVFKSTPACAANSL